MKPNHPRRIVLTGITRGLGRALLDRFANAGHIVYGCGRSADLVAQLQQQFPSPHQFAALDVGNESQVRHWAEALLAASDAPDLLINNQESVPLKVSRIKWKSNTRRRRRHPSLLNSQTQAEASGHVIEPSGTS